MQDLLRKKLSNLGARVIDLLRDWDLDGDGYVTQSEFRTALHKYKCPAKPCDIDAVYRSWDKDGSGTLSLIELFRVLRQGGATRLPGGWVAGRPARRPGGRLGLVIVTGFGFSPILQAQ